MSRFRRIVHGVASGYVALAAASLYALASVPLALHYLSKERFALWLLMSSIWNYLSLIDLGMAGSVARHVIEHKDQRTQGPYGSLIKTGWLVLGVQGLIIWSIGFAIAPLLSHLLAIPQSLQSEFVTMMRWQMTTLSFGFAMRICSHILQAHQRIDIINYSQIALLGLGFVLLWIFFHAGFGIFSLIWSYLLSAVGSAIVLGVACWRLHLFPPPGAWGRVSREHFRELFGYGKDVFLVAVGNQLIIAGQLMIVTRRLGLAEAALWGVGTRVFSLVSQIIWRIFDVSGPALSEMIVRGETRHLQVRYQAVVVVTASLSGFAAVAYALCNHSFVAVWTGFDWPVFNDVLLAVWMIIAAVTHCHNCLILATKKIGRMPHVFFGEGLVYVTSAFLLAKIGGLPAVIACSVVCSTLFTGAFGVWGISHYFKLPIREVALGWIIPMFRVVVSFGAVALVVGWTLRTISDPVLHLAIGVLVSLTLGAYLFLRLGLSTAIQQELLARLPKAINPLLRRIFVVPAP